MDALALALALDHGGHVSVPVLAWRGARWVAGPRADGTPAPLGLGFDRDGFAVSLVLERAWSVWTAAGPARDAVEDALAGLLDAGWEPG